MSEAFEPLTLRTPDGHELAARAYVPAGEVRRAVLIGAAMGVPQRFYQAFATWLATQGVAVLTFDWRGTGESAPRSLRGFKASITDWATQDLPAAADALCARWPDAPRTFLGHSLGGMIALEALRRAPDLPVQRVVCLGSPLCGSHAARSLGQRRWTAPVLGRSGALLQAGCPPWAGAVPVGMVAGNVARGVGRLIARFEGESDGTVGLAETRLPGLAAHCVVPASHTGLVFSADAARQAAHFLREGRFDGQD